MADTLSSLDRRAWYNVFKAHDARFDGRLFIGVSSTGIYCRPVCRVKMPREDNCSFFNSAAAAEDAGFRPCLKCRPELAPGLSMADAVSNLARKAALALEEDNLSDRGLAELARGLGVSDRHLRRAFAAEYGVSPVRYLQTRRLLLAKSLLTDTDLPVTDVAMASGFGSLRRFNGAFRDRYRLTPRDLRKRRAGNRPEAEEGVTLYLGYRPPYGWEDILAFLADRTVPGVESVEDGIYRRTVRVNTDNNIHRGWLTVAHAPGKHALAVTLSPSLLSVLSVVLVRVRKLFDVDCDPAEVFARLSSLNDLSPGLCRPGLRLPGSFDPFEMAVRAVLGQQITVKAARTLATRLAAAYGHEIATPFADLNRTFPSPEIINGLAPPVEDRLGPLGITGARARSIKALAEALVQGDMTLGIHADPEAHMKKLLALPGFGPWTVNYVAMRGLAWPDAFPHTDYGVRKALDGRSDSEILQLAEAWRPWRAYAAMALWRSLAPTAAS